MILRVKHVPAIIVCVLICFYLTSESTRSSIGGYLALSL